MCIVCIQYVSILYVVCIQCIQYYVYTIYCMNNMWIVLYNYYLFIIVYTYNIHTIIKDHIYSTRVHYQFLSTYRGIALPHISTLYNLLYTYRPSPVFSLHSLYSHQHLTCVIYISLKHLTLSLNTIKYFHFSAEFTLLAHLHLFKHLQ